MTSSLFGGFTRNRKNEQRNAYPPMDYGSVVPPTWSQLNSSINSVGGTGQQTLGLASVFSAVGIRSDAIATLPLNQFKGYGDTKKQITPSWIITNPATGSNITQLDFLAMIEACLCLRGNFYAQIIERDDKDFPFQLLPVHPDAVQIKRNNETNAIEYRFNNVDKVIPLDDVIHIKGLTMPNSLRALSPIEECRLSFMNAKQADHYIASLYSNGGTPSGVLYMEPGDLRDDDAARDVAAQFKQAHGGSNNAGLPVVLPNTMKWDQLSITPADAQWLQSMDFSLDLICGTIFRLPGSMYGSHAKNINGREDLEDVETGFIRNTIGGNMRRIEVALSTLLPFGQYVQFDISARMSPNNLTRWQIAQIQRNIAVVTPAEIRASEGMPPVAPEHEEWSNNPMAPLNSAQSGAYVQPGDETPVQSAPNTNPNPNSH